MKCDWLPTFPGDVSKFKINFVNCMDNLFKFVSNLHLLKLNISFFIGFHMSIKGIGIY